MTPKEKAEELVETFYIDIHEFEHRSQAKRCALIAVDEIKKSIRWSSDFNSEQKNYWKEVKQEINNL